MLTLTDVTVPDKFVDAGGIGPTLLMEGGSNGGYFIVEKFAVDVELAFGSYGDWGWSEPFKVGIGNGVIQPGTLGIRFQNHVAGSAAMVSAGLSTRQEPAVQLASAGTATPAPTVSHLASIEVAHAAAISIPSGVQTMIPFTSTFGGSDPTGVFTLLGGGQVQVNVAGLFLAIVSLQAPVGGVFQPVIVANPGGAWGALNQNSAGAEQIGGPVACQTLSSGSNLELDLLQTTGVNQSVTAIMSVVLI